MINPTKSKEYILDAYPDAFNLSKAERDLLTGDCQKYAEGWIEGIIKAMKKYNKPFTWANWVKARDWYIGGQKHEKESDECRCAYHTLSRHFQVNSIPEIQRMYRTKMQQQGASPEDVERDLALLSRCEQFQDGPCGVVRSLVEWENTGDSNDC